MEIIRAFKDCYQLKCLKFAFNLPQKNIPSALYLRNQISYQGKQIHISLLMSMTKYQTPVIAPLNFC